MLIDIKEVIVLTIFLFSIMTVYFNYIQFSYQLNISFPDKIIYYYSYINFSSSLFLCIRYLLQKKKIIGFIYVFFIIVFLTIFYTIIKE